jgi:hypothetical protein
MKKILQFITGGLIKDIGQVIAVNATLLARNNIDIILYGF